MKLLKNWQLAVIEDGHIAVLASEGFGIRLQPFADGLFRVTAFDAAAPRRKPWSYIAGDLPGPVRDRPGAPPSCQWQPTVEDGLICEVGSTRLLVRQPFALEWWVDDGHGWQCVAADRASGALALAPGNRGFQHFCAHDAGRERLYGLGEKSGALNRSRRRFVMRNVDAMGYDAREGDPLYKHIPLLIGKTAGRPPYAMFYDNTADGLADCGVEFSNYHAPFRSYRAADGEFDFWFMQRPTVRELVRGFTAITGGAALPPKWSLGYSGSTMHYTEAEDAQTQLARFVDDCAAHEIPCDSFQLSSGYTSRGGRRYVFTWNTEKIPDLQGLVAYFEAAGIKLIPNIKPALLDDHPDYARLASEALFVQRAGGGAPEVCAFWGGEGGYLDFSNPAADRWWQQQIATQLLAHGLCSTWNDNNEFEIFDDDAVLHGFDGPLPVGSARPLLTLLMLRSSHRAQKQAAPDRRPFLISRAGGPGVQAYAQTWTGDNDTSWQTLQYNIRMGLGLALSGVSNIGHDVGGFSGPRPDAELFVRWVQNGVMHPRFTIHSWNSDDTVNEPWMHDAVLPIVRDWIGFRYRLVPYFYALLWAYHRHHVPMIAPTFLHHEHDARCFAENDEFMLGPSILVASVVEPGARWRRVYLPDNGRGWFDWAGERYFSGGQEVTVAAPLADMPLFVAAGSVLPMSPSAASVARNTDRERILRVYPLPGNGQMRATLFDDDGESELGRGAGTLETMLTLVCHTSEIRLDWHHLGAFVPPYDVARIVIASRDRRPLFVNGAAVDDGDLAPFF